MRIKPSVLHVIPSLNPSHGGPSRSVPGLVDALATNSKFDLALYSQGFKTDLYIAPGAPSIDFRIATTESRLQLGLGFPLRTQLLRIPQDTIPSIIHAHGIWHPVNHWTACFARSKRIPFVIHPRGMLEAWALKQKKIKKSIAMLAYQHSDLALCDLFIATAESEYESVRRMGLSTPVAIIPNGVNLSITPDSEMMFSKTESNRTRRLLFVSRIHPKKGLLLLLEAWKAANPKGWVLEIAGPDEDGYLEVIKNRIVDLGLQHTVTYLGEIAGQSKADAYRRADLFILPTHSENFGLVVAEALSFSVPVITTKGAPWRDLVDYECGWWVDISVEAITDAISKATGMSDFDRHALGSNARKYVERYNWSEIALKMSSAYEWLINKNEKPDFVYSD